MMGPYIEALDAAGLGWMMGGQWSCEDREGCDTAWMLHTVESQTGEDPVSLDDAISLLKCGHAPRGATPYPWMAQRLLDIRLAETEFSPEEVRWIAGGMRQKANQ